MNTVRKIFASTLVLATILSVSGFGLNTVKAAAMDGDLIKMNGLSTVYYYKGGKRFVFPNLTTYKSWYADFSGVKVISQSELESYPLGANVTMRPGTYLIKITTNPNVYAVEPGGKLRAIASEAAALSLYGTNWAQKIVDVPDGFWSNYSITTALGSNYPAGTLVKAAGGADTYYYDGTNYRKIASESAFYANRFRFDFVQTTSMAMTPLGMEITGAEAGLIDTSSGASGTITGSGLSVALAADTPASMNVPSQATGVKMAKFNFTAANDGDIILSELTVKRTGVGAPGEIAKLYLYDGATRLTTGRTLNTSTNEAVFTNIGLTITKSTTKTITVVADIADNTTAGSHAIGIELASKVVASGATVSGSFPATGNMMSFSTVNVGLVDVESNGSAYTRKVGETNVEVGNFIIYSGGTPNEDASFKGITLYNSGRDVLTNLKLYRGSDVVATAVKNGSYFTFTLATPITVLKGNSASFTVKGDVGGRDGDTATLMVRYKTDIVTTGNTYGFGMGVSAAVGSGANSYIDEVDSSPQSNTTTVDAGQLTVALNGPAAGSVSKNTNDVVMMNFTLTPQATVEVSKMTVYVGGSNLVASDVENLEVKINGTSVYSTSTVAVDDDNDITSGTVGHNTSTDTFSLAGGVTANGQIIIDVTNTAGGNEVFKAALMNLTSTTYWTIKTMDGDAVTDIVPSGNIVGNNQSVIAASLTLDLASNPANGSSYVKGATNVPVAGFAFTTGSATAVKVNSIKITAMAADDGNINAAGEVGAASNAEDVIVAVGLYVDNVLLAPKKSLTVGSSDITATFDSLNWTIPAGTVKNVVAKADISSTAPLSGTDDEIAFTIYALGDVSCEYGNGTSFAAVLNTNNNGNTPSVGQVITSGGTIAMALDASSPLASLLTAGTQNVTYGKAKLTTTKEAFKVTKLRLTNSANDSNFVSVGLEYKKADGTTGTATSTLVGGTANFSFAAGNEPYLAKDADTLITIKGNLNTTVGGAANAQASTLSLESDAGFEAYGVESSLQKTAVDSGADATSRTMTVYESKPSVAFDNTGLGGNISGNTAALVAKIKITADAGKDITFVTGGSGGEITLAINAINATSSDDEVVTLKDENGTTLDTDTLDLTTGAQSVVFDFSSNSLTVPAGESKYIYVYADTSEFLDAGDFIQFWLDDGASTNFEWGINGSGVYEHADILFRGDLMGPSWNRTT